MLRSSENPNPPESPPLPDSLGVSSDMFAFACFPGTKPKHISGSFPATWGPKAEKAMQIKGALSD